MGAREGLFRAAFGAVALERLDTHPVRSLVALPGGVLAGGEEGLYRIDSGRVVRIPTADPWIESVGTVSGQTFVATATGLLRGVLGGPLTAVTGGEDVAMGVVHDDAFWTTTAPPGTLVRRIDVAGRVHAERLPSLVRRLVAADDALFADTEDGLFGREAGGWRRARARPPALPAGFAHVSALSFLGTRLVAGAFGGGLAVLDEPRREWRAVTGSAAWGVNALLPAGGVLFVASLRGAARFDGVRLSPLDGPGAAFSLAATREGVAIGYGQGVLLPGSGLLSAFHGLPGNQALALAAGDGLFVGTPSGLGVLDGRRVRWSRHRERRPASPSLGAGPAPRGGRPVRGDLRRRDRAPAERQGSPGRHSTRAVPGDGRDEDRRGRSPRGRRPPLRRHGGTGPPAPPPGPEPVRAARPAPALAARHRARRARRRALGGHGRGPPAPAAGCVRRSALRSSLLAAALLLAAGPAHPQAGLLVPTSSGRPDASVLALREMAVDVGLARGYARVGVRQVFENRTGVVQEGTYRFRLPPSAAIGDFAVWDGLVRVPGVILEKQRARAIYEELTRQRIDPGLLQQGEEDEGIRPSGGAAFSARVAPIPPGPPSGSSCSSSRTSPSGNRAPSSASPCARRTASRRWPGA